MTKSFTEIIKLSDSSLKGFEVAEKNANSQYEKSKKLLVKKEEID